MYDAVNSPPYLQLELSTSVSVPCLLIHEWDFQSHLPDHPLHLPATAYPLLFIIHTNSNIINRIIIILMTICLEMQHLYALFFMSFVCSISAASSSGVPLTFYVCLFMTKNTLKICQSCLYLNYFHLTVISIHFPFYFKTYT